MPTLVWGDGIDMDEQHRSAVPTGCGGCGSLLCDYLVGLGSDEINTDQGRDIG